MNSLDNERECNGHGDKEHCKVVSSKNTGKGEKRTRIKVAGESSYRLRKGEEPGNVRWEEIQRTAGGRYLICVKNSSETEGKVFKKGRDQNPGNEK